MKSTKPLLLGIKAFGSAFGTMLVCFLVFTFVAIESAAFIVAFGILCLLLVFSSAYGMVWREGSADYNRVKFEHTQYDPNKGLKAGLVAVAPWVAIWAATVVCKLCGVDLLAVYRLCNMHVMVFINLIFPWNASFEQVSVGQLLLSGLHLPIMPLLCWVGYRMGYRQFSILERTIYKNVGKNQKAKPPRGE